MGAGWIGAMGAGWFDATGAGWFDAGSGRAGRATFPMAADAPLAEEPIGTYHMGAKFPQHGWDPDLLALRILPEFLSGGLALAVSAPTAVTNSDIEQLLELAVTERPQRMAEIVQQDQNFQLCWMQLLMITPASHRATFLLMKMAARVGEVSMIHCKLQYPQAPRPSQICPTLYPPVPVSGHSPYPAGHALVGHLTSRCLVDVLADPADGSVPASRKGLEKALALKADRVAWNRVIAGLHFPQDNAEGKRIAEQEVFPKLQACQSYIDVLALARAEWS